LLKCVIELPKQFKVGRCDAPDTEIFETLGESLKETFAVGCAILPILLKLHNETAKKPIPNNEGKVHCPDCSVLDFLVCLLAKNDELFKVLGRI
jgi:hypothetical protein